MWVGVDAAYDSVHALVAAAAVAWNPDDRLVVERHTAVAIQPAAYVPGRFAEREAAVAVAALRALHARPALVMCDGHGRAHPQRWGMACEIASLTGWPTIGCAKSLLCGRHDPVGPARGDCAELKLDGKVVGRVVRTQTNVRPVYVSVGGFLELDAAVQMILRATPCFRIPEPLRLAHQFARLALARVLASS